jgi:hypothetical protein
MAKDDYANFPTLENVVLSGEGVLKTVPDWIQGDILSYLENIMHSFDDYFIQDELKMTSGFEILSPLIWTRWMIPLCRRTTSSIYRAKLC